MLYRRTLFWGAWLSLLLPAGSSAEGFLLKEMIGVLGEDATFPLENPNSFDAVLWYRNEAQVASWRRGPPSELQLFKGYEGRDVTVSQDCSSLTVRGLREEDSAGYKAQMLRNFEEIGSPTFILNVYKRLSEADLNVVCAREILKDGNETFCLNCSVGQWEDGVEYSWTSSGQGGPVSSSGKSLVLLFKLQDDDQNVTCMVKNPVGNTSRTVSLKQTCASAGEQSTRRPPTVTDRDTDAAAKTGIIVTAVVLALLLIAAAAAIIWKCRRNKTAAERDLMASSSSSGPNECKSLYVEIHTVAEDIEKKKPHQRKGPGASKEVPATIYAEVQHPDKSPLQTDDEKMRREKRKAAEKSEKTIYSEIPNVKETTKENPKTIYDTVTHPRPPEASEYNKIL